MRMAETIGKRTFGNGATMELFKRADGIHRIKYTGLSGDEISFNIDQIYKHELIKYAPAEAFERIAYAERHPEHDGVGSRLSHNIALFHFLTNLGPDIKQVMKQVGPSLHDISWGEDEITNFANGMKKVVNDILNDPTIDISEEQEPTDSVLSLN